MSKQEIMVAQPVTPMDLISRAQESNASIEQMQQLFELQLRYEANEARKAYHQAIADFKTESIIILKDKKVGFESKATGERTSYSHATLGNIIQTVIPVMSKHGLSHSWEVKQEGAAISVTCHLAHSMGHSTHVTMTAGKDDSGKKNAIQQIASTITYLERYTFLAITGLAAQDQDDDGKNSEVDAVELISIDQANNLQTLMKEVGVSEKPFCTYWKIDAVIDLPLSKYSQAVNSLEAKRKVS